MHRAWTAALWLAAAAAAGAQQPADPPGDPAAVVAASVPASAPARPAQATGDAAASPVQTLHAALGAPGESPAFPEDPAVAQPVTLPDEWARSRPGAGGSRWYRVAFRSPPPTAPQELLGLLVGQACSGLVVRLNGELLYADEPSAHDCERPQLLALPASLLRADGNRIDLRITAPAFEQTGSRLRAGMLSALQVGPYAALAPMHAVQTALRVTAPQALVAALLLTGIYMFALGLFKPRDGHLRYFGALSVGWALLNAGGWLRPVLSHAHTEFFTCVLLGLTAWAAVQFLLRLGGTRWRWADVGLPLQTALMVLTLLLAGPQRLRALALAWDAVLVLEVTAAAVWYLRRQSLDAGGWVMGALLGVAAGAGVVHAAVQWLGAPPMAAHLAALVMPVMMSLVGLRLVQQQGRALNDAEHGRAQLELRVREATAEIERNYRQMAELRVEQVTERERKRIAGDLHDDLGAKLLTIVHTSDNERISTLAREALEEMRLSVRGLTGRPVRLADALGDWRVEVVSRLSQAGVAGDWNAPEEAPQTLSARAYVQTTRILRETTSNIIKHSGAGRCTFEASIADGDFQLVIRDDGRGIATEVEGRLDRGHGLASMKNRARQLQGQCLVESAPGFGTVIRLTIPLDRTPVTA